MKTVLRFALAAGVGGLLALPAPVHAQDRDPFGFYGFYQGQCPRDPVMCRTKPGCICDINREVKPPEPERDKRSNTGPVLIRIGQ